MTDKLAEAAYILAKVAMSPVLTTTNDDTLACIMCGEEYNYAKEKVIHDPGCPWLLAVKYTDEEREANE